jgi:hypothetical protein
MISAINELLVLDEADECVSAEGEGKGVEVLVAGGGPGVDAGTDLRMSEDIWIAAPADILGAGTEGVVVESGRDFPVGEGKGLGYGKGI